eukprot:snap_masked-scaffold_56-processed-gene-0.17-mRNA-1 protein AED:1.00 eAED:1.00 QI:0/0/0/0/1/1/2/0/207
MYSALLFELISLSLLVITFNDSVDEDNLLVGIVYTGDDDVGEVLANALLCVVFFMILCFLIYKQSKVFGCKVSAREILCSCWASGLLRKLKAYFWLCPCSNKRSTLSEISEYVENQGYKAISKDDWEEYGGDEKIVALCRVRKDLVANIDIENAEEVEFRLESLHESEHFNKFLEHRFNAELKITTLDLSNSGVTSEGLSRLYGTRV